MLLPNSSKHNTAHKTMLTCTTVLLWIILIMNFMWCYYKHKSFIIICYKSIPPPWYPMQAIIPTEQTDIVINIFKCLQSTRYMSITMTFIVEESPDLTVTMWRCAGLWLLPSGDSWSQWPCDLLWHEGRWDGLQPWTVLTGLAEQSAWPGQTLVWFDCCWAQQGHLLHSGEW